LNACNDTLGPYNVLQQHAGRRLTSNLPMSLRAMVSLLTDWNMVIRVPSLCAGSSDLSIVLVTQQSQSDHTMKHSSHGLGQQPFNAPGAAAP
jgi:hypothetical protein